MSLILLSCSIFFTFPIFRQKLVYFCLAKWIVPTFSVPTPTKTTERTSTLFRLPFFFSILATACNYWCQFSGYCKHLTNLVNPSWLWRINLGIWANQKLRNILNKHIYYTCYVWLYWTNSFFFQLLVYPGKMLRLLLLWYLHSCMETREKIINNKWLPKADLPSESCILNKSTEGNKVHFAY